jgi:hypothetical protein
VSVGYYWASALSALNSVVNFIFNPPFNAKFSFLATLLHFFTTLVSSVFVTKNKEKEQNFEISKMGLTLRDVSLVTFLSYAFWSQLRHQTSLLGIWGVFSKFLVGFLSYSFMVKFFNRWLLTDPFDEDAPKNETNLLDSKKSFFAKDSQDSLTRRFV